MVRLRPFWSIAIHVLWEYDCEYDGCYSHEAVSRAQNRTTSTLGGSTHMLPDAAVKNAKPGKSIFRLADSEGLALEVTPAGGKHWRFRYRRDGKADMLGLGSYPAISLKDARARRDEARRLLAQGIDPAKARQEQHAESAMAANTFETITREWNAKTSPRWSESYAEKVLHRFETDIFPWLGGGKPIFDITAPEILTTIRRVEARGAHDIAKRLLQGTGSVFRYAIATGRAERDPAADFKGALPPRKVKHHASIIEPKKVAKLLRDIDEYQGSVVSRCALRLAPLVFVRPGELRKAEWSEIDLEQAEWRIPAEKMKMASPHIVPLSKQALAILEEIKPLTGSGRYVFPSLRTSLRPMSENTVSYALRNRGYSGDEQTGHGFGSLASTLLNELGWNRDAIER